jgi:hypothetical protein
MRFLRTKMPVCGAKVHALLAFGTTVEFPVKAQGPGLKASSICRLFRGLKPPAPSGVFDLRLLLQGVEQVAEEHGISD